MYYILVCPQYTGLVAEGFIYPANGAGDLSLALSLSGFHTKDSQIPSAAMALHMDLLSPTAPSFPEQVPAPPQGLLCRWMEHHWADSLAMHSPALFWSGSFRMSTVEKPLL